MPTVAERMEAKFSPEPNTGCFLWFGSVDQDGYGIIRIGGRKGRKALAHRVAWELAHGPIPAGLVVRHVVCDTPACVNPAHLALGTNLDNIADRNRKGRQAKGDRTGPRLYPERYPRGDNHPHRRRPDLVPRGDSHWARRHPEWYRRGADSWSAQHPERVARGEGHGRAKLDDDAIRAIREAFAMGGISRGHLAIFFGVSHATICRVIKRAGWAHVA